MKEERNAVLIKESYFPQAREIPYGKRDNPNESNWKISNNISSITVWRYEEFPFQRKRIQIHELKMLALSLMFLLKIKTFPYPQNDR